MKIKLENMGIFKRELPKPPVVRASSKKKKTSEIAKLERQIKQEEQSQL
uniref:Uncharacterized protein n=1 Tax=Mimivirus LCMiAC01 TaxID=2506608 RepID=A0A481Z146_9VIRU|nr:MAG: hypothetical protein LCMiAC01_00700 [Mimivirus LCMiAC01]